MAPSKPTFESIVANALLEERNVGCYDLGQHSSQFHFTRLSVRDAQSTPDEDVIPILLTNRVLVGSPAPDQSELRRLVLFAKCFHLHMFNFAVRQGRTCGYCREVIHKNKLCSQCKVYRYCNRECQGKHWRVHRAFCGLQRERDDIRNSIVQYCLSDNPNKLEGTDQTDLSSKIWDGKENDYFDRTLALFLQHSDMSLGIPFLLKSLPPTVAQVHGPAEFWKMASYSMDQIEAADFAHERNEWLSVLDYCFDPYWPESYENHDETKLLKPNVEAFVSHGGPSRLLRIMLRNPESVEAFTAVLHNLARYRDIIQVATDEPLRKPANEGCESGFIFDSLSLEIKQIIFHDFLRDFFRGKAGIQDQLNFGRTCKAAAHTICAVLEKTCMLGFKQERGWDELNSFLTKYETKLVENELGNVPIHRAAQVHPELFLPPQAVTLVRQIYLGSNTFEISISCGRQMYCAMLQTWVSLQIASGCCYAEEVVPSDLTQLENLVLIVCEKSIGVHRRWVAPYSRIAAWIKEQAQ